ncbi:hypothetical protein NEOLI_002487 [Neolecta irregularis DAH-3]|uniref:PI31 proteasome regulator N-terminal domain-containing protein n=1 Tax=Neolecta irregularis (strain DAH-3) TaxID=1198029 RepID=A0A1U7LRW2_NEOID|nr:hypothetical protein NEOLI_002487 [Neolecta irregularis DAH-3]|eukprot:OLL25384.1 hypothetical protein NEOLI_002487 [Neolecta irregularis DAH-3]
MSTNDALLPSNLINIIKAAVSAEEDSPSSSHELLKTPYEAIALLCHASMVAYGFHLLGFSEDDNLGISAFDSKY